MGTLTALVTDAEGNHSTATASFSVIAALVAGGYFDSQAIVNVFAPKVLRQYNTPGKIPASYTPQWVVPGLKIALPSIKPDHPTFDQDAAVAQYAVSLASYCAAHGIRPCLIIEHEPENKTKQPNDSPVNYSQEFLHYLKVVKAAAPAVEVWACEMTYTSDDRPVDTLGHTTLHTNEWLTELHAESIAAGYGPAGVSFDGYPDFKTNETAQANFGPCFALVHAFPGWEHMPVAVAEWGYGDPSDVNTAAHIAAGMTYFATQGVQFVSYFNSPGPNPGPWPLDNRPLSIKALMGNS